MSRKRRFDFLDLPEVALQRLFEFLDVEDKCLLGGVCRFLYVKTRRPIAWKKLSIRWRSGVHRARKLPGFMFVSELRKIHIDLRDCNGRISKVSRNQSPKDPFCLNAVCLTPFINRIAFNCPGLRCVILENCHYLFRNVVAKLQQRCPRVQSLTLKNCDYAFLYDGVVCEMVRAWEGLKHLHIEGCLVTSGKFWRFVGKHCPNLESIGVIECGANIADRVYSLASERDFEVEYCGPRSFRLKRYRPSVTVFRVRGDYTKRFSGNDPTETHETGESREGDETCSGGALAPDFVCRFPAFCSCAVCRSHLLAQNAPFLGYHGSTSHSDDQYSAYRIISETRESSASSIKRIRRELL